MMRYAETLRQQDIRVDYIEHRSSAQPMRDYMRTLAASGVQRPIMTDPHDYLLDKRVRACCEAAGLQLQVLPTPQFINTSAQNSAYRAGKNDGLWRTFINISDED